MKKDGKNPFKIQQKGQKMSKPTSSTDLKFILGKGEDYKTEFKEEIYKKLDREIVAFANASGGKIYIGITDEGKIKGINITNKVKNQIKDIAKNCDPKVSISFQEMKKEKVLIVKVEEGNEKPHRCSSGFYIRSGASSQKLNTKEIRNFMEEEGVLRFDSLPCKKFIYKEHFDKEKLFYFLDKSKIKYSRRNYLQLLENLEVAKRQGSKIIFNNAGAVFFSKNLKRIFFQTEIICGLFKGTDKGGLVLNNENFNTDLIGNIEGAMEFLWKSLRARHEIVPRTAQRINVLEIPDKALREALINAVIHTNYLEEGTSVTVEVYDDRVEISNFGGLPKRLKRELFGKMSVRRNPLIADLMARAGYIERMGTGIKKMRDLVKAEGLSPIKFKFSDFTTVIFYRKPLPGGNLIKSPAIKAEENLREKLSEITGIRGEKINELLQILYHIEEETFSKLSFSKNYNVAPRTLDRDITLLKKHKLILFKGPPKSGRYKITDRYKKLKA